MTVQSIICQFVVFREIKLTGRQKQVCVILALERECLLWSLVISVILSNIETIYLCFRFEY